MLRRSIYAIIIVILIFLCVSCNNEDNNDNATIQIWTYTFGDTGYTKGISAILSNVKFFCDTNEIPIEIFKYDDKTMPYKDYILKRNISVANGNAIIIEDARLISDLYNQHADYTKLDNYNILFDSYKNRFCIPLGIAHNITLNYNDAINYYDINTDKLVITYDEYLQLKQQMKEKGARFNLSGLEFKHSVDYFLIKNNLKYINNESTILKNRDDLKKAIKNTVIELCDDFISYNDNLINDNIKNLFSNNGINVFNKNDYTVYDENSELTLCDFQTVFLDSLTHYGNYVNSSIFDKTVVIDPDIHDSPCFFMYKKITNDRIYDLANYIVSENSYLYVTERYHAYSPVFDGKKTRSLFEVDENWQYQGVHEIAAKKGSDSDKKLSMFYNKVYDILVVNKEKSNLLAEYYFINREYSETIYNLVADIIIDLSNKGYDYKNEENNKMIDNKIDEFVTNFNIYYK